MAKRKGAPEARVFADEKFIAEATDFVSRHRGKLILIFCVVMAAVVVWIVGTHAARSYEEEVAEYLEENLYKPLGIGEGSQSLFSPFPEPSKPIKVDEILERVKGTEARPYVLWILAKYLFEQGGEPNLRKAKKLAETCSTSTPIHSTSFTRATQTACFQRSKKI